ncbi:MAG: tRNA guanosine(15) transglycosylase TgtA [Candidatus Bathycorpusculaceae bacterium]
MSFEVKEKDLLARIGRLKTKSGVVETPLLFPVINPAIQPIPPKEMGEEFGIEALITNAYILKRRFQDQPAEKGIGKFLDFNGVVMTDSGAYQILVYGDIEMSSAEIVEYQERIDSDIATILDIPTGWRVSRGHAEQTVYETLRRAKDFFKIKTRDDILWVGPVQGGKHFDLVAECAVEMEKLPFQIYALGSPTEVMENYRFDVLVDMIMSAKMNLPLEKPLHLFGAGHPFMFSLAVALGCDLFDSAAYAIYAREDRYMTETGTWRLNELEYFPCPCKKCAKKKPKDILDLPQSERQTFLAGHNLYMCIAELKRIKQAIRDGRLWEHLEMRAHGHPALLQALKKFGKYGDFIEKCSPTVKQSGLFFFDSVGLVRPEVVRHRIRMARRYYPPEQKKILLLAPQTRKKPFHRSEEFKRVQQLLKREVKGRSDRVHVCFYAAPFGVIPIELDEVYPLSQHETALPVDHETAKYVAAQVASYVARSRYKAVVLLNDSENWGGTIRRACRRACLKNEIRFECLKIRPEQGKTILASLGKILQECLSDPS